MTSFKSYTDLKAFYPTQVFDLGFQVDQTDPKNVLKFEQHKVDPTNEVLFITLIRHTETKVASDGKKLKFKIFLKATLDLKEFLNKH